MSGARAASVSAISLTLVAILALSLACLAAGRGSSLWSRHARRGYDFRAGWLAFSSNRLNNFATKKPLRETSYGVAVAGAVSAAALVASSVLSAVSLTLCLLGKSGGWLSAVAVPAAVVVAAPLFVFQALIAIYGSKAIQRETGLRWVPWPDVGWCLGVAAAFLWWLVCCLACVLPKKREKFSVSTTPTAAAPPQQQLARAASSEKKNTATAFIEGMSSEDAAALGAPPSRPGSAAAAVAAAAASIPDYKIPKFSATKASDGGRSSRGGSKSGGEAKASASPSSSAPVAPASAFGGGTRASEDDDEGPSVAAPAVLPEAPPPEALPAPARLGFFSTMKKSLSRVYSASAEKEVEGGGGRV